MKRFSEGFDQIGHTMSIRTALIGGMLAVGTMATVIVGALGVASISGSVRREAQERVNQDLKTVHAHYEDRLTSFAERIADLAKEISWPDESLPAHVQQLKQELGLVILNVCDASGRPVTGSYPDFKSDVPVRSDPVLRRALGGKLAWGTVLLQPERLQIEGGPALQNALVVRAEGGDGASPTTSALLWWAAYPIRDHTGRVAALLYGGRPLNLNFELVDELRELAFGTRLHTGKPLGTVTIFLRGVRVATNVLGPDRRRAVGTYVSPQVQKAVLERGELWQDRAWVVDAWYLSAYEPLHDPDGGPIGMLYVGLLEAPYAALRTRLITRSLGLTILAGIVALVVAIFIVNRITSPIRQLSETASAIARGGADEDREVAVRRSYAEINHLAHVFREMQRAISQRDRSLREQNARLGETNDKLERVNRNYMETLGFVTHELKAPLAAIQSMIDVVVNGYTGDVPEKTASFLQRIRRSSEELQDMVKNYLDLSRAERGELVATKSAIDFRAAVVDPCVQQTQPLFDSRGINLTVVCPPGLDAQADPELMRIAVSNYLTNAAKYGRERGSARLEVHTENGKVTVSVWNEGAGFTPKEADALFKKFSRLKNDNTKGKRGSGLGLFLCKEIAGLHGGRVWAEAEPGQWARFYLSFPIATKE